MRKMGRMGKMSIANLRKLENLGEKLISFNSLIVMLSVAKHLAVGAHREILHYVQNDRLSPLISLNSLISLIPIYPIYPTR